MEDLLHAKQVTSLDELDRVRIRVVDCNHDPPTWAREQSYRHDKSLGGTQIRLPSTLSAVGLPS
jgi:hypothetical protein